MKFVWLAWLVVLTGCSRAPPAIDPIFEIRRAELAPAPGFQKVPTGPFNNIEPVFVFEKSELLPRHVLRAEIEEFGDAIHVNIQLTAEGQKLLQSLSRSHVQRHLAVFFLGQLVSLPLVRSELPGPTGGIIVSGRFSRTDAEIVCNRLSQNKDDQR